MRKSHSLWLAFALAVFSFSLAPAAHAQYPGYLTNSNDTGLPSYGAFISSNIDTVNLGTGGVSIRIPVSSVTGRGKSYSTYIQYESKYWTSVPAVQPGSNGPVVYYSWVPDGTIPLGQLRTSAPDSIGGLNWTETLFSCDMPPQGGDAGAEMVYMFGPATVMIRSNYVYTSSDGSRHQIPLRNNYPQLYPGYCPNLNNGQLPPNQVAETDNGQVRVDLTQDQYNPTVGGAPIITLADGTHTSSLGESDSNGNICCAAGRPTMTLETGSTQTHQVWDVVDSNGSTHQLIIDYVDMTLSTAFPTTSYDAWHQVFQYTGQIRVISKITLPNGLAYNFTYDPNFGEVTKITLPTGGYVRYVWATLAQADSGPADPLSTIMATPYIDARRISERIVSEDGTTGSEKVWNYSYPTGPGGFLSGITTVTDPAGNYEKHFMGQCGVPGFNSLTGYPSIDGGASYYDASGKLLKTVSPNWTCDKGALYIAYPGKNLPATYSLLTEGVINLRQTGTITTLGDTNQVAVTQSDFNDCYNYTIYALTYTSCRNNPTETREYDYGIGAPGSLVRKTDFTYLHNSNSAYLNAHIWDRVKLKSVYDGSGNLVAQTQYGYDENTITPYVGATNHDDTNYPAGVTLRGNVTTVGRWLNTTGTFLTTTNVYNQVGNLVQTTDPGGHTYNLYYDDNYSDGVDRRSQAFLTHVTSPTTSNGIPHVEGKQYFWYTGLTAAVCGQNAPLPATCTNSLNPTAGSPVSDYAKYSYDLMNRPATVTHGDGGVTNFTFNESSFPFSVSSSSQIDPSQNLVNTALIDGLGRVKQTQLNSDPDGADFVDTTYDDVGQKSTVSNPHRSGTATTDGVTTYLYDALGRTTTVIPPDGTTSSNNVKTFYRGNSVTVVDQAGKARRSYTDGLGRLIEVDEPAAGSALPGLAATYAWGSLSIGGSEQVNMTMVNEGQTCQIYDCGGNCISWQTDWEPVYTYDSGTVYVTAGGHTDSVSYGSWSSPANLAAALAAAINADSAAVVTASPTGATINFVARSAGSSGDLSVSALVASSQPGQFPNSFNVLPGSVILVGGADPIPSFPPGETVNAQPYVTLYTYDTLDNLTCVEQHGTATGQTGCSSAPSSDSGSAWRIRRFTYDSLSRLVTAKNPESGTISYTYDSDGNVVTKTDARGITTTMAYDQLHRVISKTYSDGTPTYSFTYDLNSVWGNPITNPIGRMVLSTTPNIAGTELFSYDSRGRTVKHWQCVPGVCGYEMDYAYNFAGGATSKEMAGVVISQSFDSAARVIQVTSNIVDPQHPATLATINSFTPAGAVSQMTYGNGLVETSAYNNRLQPSQLRTYNPANNADILNLSYGFTNSAGANNGNVVTFNSTATQIFMRTYTYDELNRLSTMASPTDASGCYGLTWNYDAWANRLSQNTAGGSGSACASPNHGVLMSNRITDTGFSHDAAGNTLTDGNHGYTYDAESRLVSLDGGAATYAYNGSGQRMAKTISAGTIEYLYDEGGNVVTDINPSTTPWSYYIYLNGSLLAEYKDNTTYFVHKDHLGSTRVMTKLDRTVYDSMDYLPYGEQIAGGSGSSHKFTGKEHDAESGLDNFGARYMSSSLGRFVSADWSATPEPIPYADFSSPQSLNLYAYVRNNPLNRADADGHCSAPQVGKGQVGICIDYYISTKTVDKKGMGKHGLGDNRGPTGNDKEHRYRAEIKLVIDRADGKVTGTSQAGLSQFKFGVTLNAPGKESTGLSASTDSNGNIHLDVDTTAKNGFLAMNAPGAPAGQIEGDVRLVVTPDNKVGTDPGGSRTAYPALEIYSYQQGKEPLQILNMPQSSDSNDLTKGKTQVIPQKDPK